MRQDPLCAGAHELLGGDMNRKGVCYDVGIVMGGDWRPDYDPKIVASRAGDHQTRSPL